MKKFSNIIGTIILTCLMLTISSCQKEDDHILPKTITTQQITGRYFNDFQTLELELALVEEISDLDSLTDYETSKNYMSLGRMSDLVYKIFENDDLPFSSDADIMDYYHANERFLDLEIDNDGELSITPKYSNNPYRYFSDADGIIQVGDKALRVLSDVVIITESENIELLREIEEDALRAELNSGIFSIYYAEEITLFEGNSLTNHNNCVELPSSPILMNSDDGRHRTKVDISYSKKLQSPANIGSCFYVFLNVNSTVQKKVFGIWFATKTSQHLTVTANVHHIVSNSMNLNAAIWGYQTYRYDRLIEKKTLQFKKCIFSGLITPSIFNQAQSYAHLESMQITSENSHTGNLDITL